MLKTHFLSSTGIFHRKYFLESSNINNARISSFFFFIKTLSYSKNQKK